MGLWMGETGGASHSGRNTVTNRFMSAFWYLDWLGKGLLGRLLMINRQQTCAALKRHVGKVWSQIIL